MLWLWEEPESEDELFFLKDLDKEDDIADISTEDRDTVGEGCSDDDVDIDLVVTNK